MIEGVFMNYGDKIRYARKQAGKTSGELAEYIGVSQPMISKVENGFTEFSPANLKKVSEYLKTPIAFFLKENYIPLEEAKLNGELKRILKNGDSADYIVLAEGARLSDVSLEELEEAINYIIKLKKRAGHN